MLGDDMSTIRRTGSTSERLGRARCGAVRLTLVGLIVGAGLVGGCSNTASDLLSTGSLFSSKPAQPAAAPAATATDRAIQVGAVSARAQKCGYFFDPAKLRANFLAAETAQGLTPEQVAKLGQDYDTVLARVAAAIAKDAGYCGGGKTAEIKGDLGRHLAGDFAPPKKATEASTLMLLEADETTKAMDREAIFNRHKQRF